MTNVYGTQNLDGYMLDRYHVSTYRENETPIEKVQVGPGLNKGYTSEPSGDFNNQILDYILPKQLMKFVLKLIPKYHYGRINL